MRLKFTDNLAKVEADLDAWAQGIRDVAIPRALNTLRDQAQVAGLRAINEAYAIGPRTMQAYLRGKSATAGDPQANIEASGKTFGPAVYRPVETRQGTVVTIKGKRVLLPHAFVVAAFGERVMARGAFGGVNKASGESRYGFAFGRGRFPIASPFTLRPAHVFGAQATTDAMDARVAEQAASVLAREIGAAKRGF